MLYSINFCLLLALICPRISNALAKTNNLQIISWNKQLKEAAQLGQDYHVFINTNNSLLQVDEKFLSFALPAILAKAQEKFDPRNKLLLTLTKALTPAYLRFGGTGADFLIFEQRNSTSHYNDANQNLLDSSYATFFAKTNHTNFTMSAARWDDLNSYCQQTGVELLFNLNVLLRSGRSWDDTNAKQLLRYSVAKQCNKHMHLQLGNEPNAFKYLVNKSLPAAQLGEDFLSLRALLNSDPVLAGHFNRSLVVGPDISNLKETALTYLKEYLETVGNQIDRVTVHQYYGVSESYVKGDFLDPQLMDSLIGQIKSVVAVVRAANVSRPVWLGETASFSGGGVPGVSDSYKSGFLWLDKLGVSARYGVDVVIRQTLYISDYSMISPQDFTPYPDYWLSLLYKRLVGKQVLDVHMSGGVDVRHVRVYAHCTNLVSERYKRGSVTLYVLNLRNETSNIELSDPRLISSTQEIYWLTPHGSAGLVSKQVELNGVKLEMIDEATLPDLLPQKAPRGSRISLPRQSFGFIVFPDALSPACQGA